MRQWALVLWLAAACGGAGSGASQCTPACSVGLICCSEPVHGGDAGVTSAFECVTPSGSGACPMQP
jgi:hypothetical protein